MNKAYTRINWENEPSSNTPINETNLNKIDAALNEVDNRLIEQDTEKASKLEVATLIASVDFDESTGIITVTRKNGSSFTIDTKLEKIAVNFDYDPVTQQIILTLVDGTKQYIDLSALITEYEFLDSDTITFVVQSDGKIKAEVLDGSITESKLQPNYLATIKVEVAKSEASATSAATSEANALASENAAKISETNAKTSETNAKNSEKNASTSADTASAKATEAGKSANAAATSATNASSSATTATNKATAAANSATSASKSADTATNKASEASTSATNANTYAIKSQSYAVGGTGTRENEDIDNAQYYYQQAKAISESFSGALRPMGTVTFANLPYLSSATEGDMYNVADQFVTTADFKEGSGLTIPAGSNVYKTSDGKWDVLAGSPVTGVKGANETTFQSGNVNITAEGVGAVAIGGDTAENIVDFTSGDSETVTGWTDVPILASGERHSSLCAKISNMFKNIRYLYKILGTTDISAIGDGTATGAISSINSNLDNLGRCLYLTETTGTTNWTYLELKKPLSNYRMVMIYITDTSGNMINALSIPTEVFKFAKSATKFVRVVENGAGAWGQMYYKDDTHVYAICSSNTTVKLVGMLPIV